MQRLYVEEISKLRTNNDVNFYLSKVKKSLIDDDHVHVVGSFKNWLPIKMSTFD